MKKVSLSTLDKSDTFFHFTREENLESIEQNGLIAKCNGENAVLLDYKNRAIYFSKGVSGVLKLFDVWIRWEYNHMSKVSGHIEINTKTMQKVYEKMYHDFSHRKYLALDLIEGDDPKTSDFSYYRKDYKKILASNSIAIYNAFKWCYGPYSDIWSFQMEDWNMNTHYGPKVIPSSRISIVEASNGKTDALSVIIEMYEQNKDKYFYLSELKDFLTYIKK